MRKIAFIIKNLSEKYLYNGGEGKVFFNLINRFIKNNYAVDIYCNQTDISKFEGINKIILIECKIGRKAPASLEEFYTKIGYLTKGKEYDFIVGREPIPPADIALIQCHSLTHDKKKIDNILLRFLYGIGKGKRINYETKWFKNPYKKIFVVSKSLKKDFMINFDIPQEKISVIYPGVNISNDIEIKEFNKEITFGISATGIKNKGGYIFLKALKILKEKKPNFKAKIIYPKHKKNLWIKLLVKFYKIEDNVEFIEFQQNMQDFYSSIDCLVLASIHEAFGLVVLEAMAHKKICIVSSSAGASEIIEEGVNGYVFQMDKNAADNLAEKMCIVIDTLEAAKVLNNVNNVSNQLINVYNTAKSYDFEKTCTAFENNLPDIY